MPNKVAIFRPSWLVMSSGSSQELPLSMLPQNHAWLQNIRHGKTSDRQAGHPETTWATIADGLEFDFARDTGSQHIKPGAEN